MGKVTKTNMAVTIDTWVYNWISEQGGKKSTLVNSILKEHIINNDAELKQQKTLIELTPSEKRASFEAHMNRLLTKLDDLEEFE